MICCTADGTTVRALLLKGAANAGRQKTALRKRPVRNCFMLIILLDKQGRDAGLQGRRILIFRRKLITTSIPIGQFGRKFPAVSLPSGASSTSSDRKSTRLNSSH